MATAAMKMTIFAVALLLATGSALAGPTAAADEVANHARRLTMRGSSATVASRQLIPQITPGTGFATDFDAIPEIELRAEYEPSAFVFTFAEAESETPGGNLRPNTIHQNQLLATLPGNGAGQNLVTIEACGLNQPHVHPRGTEVSFVTEGEFLFGFHEENGGRLITANMTVGQTIVIPQGLMHFAQNLSCKRSQFLANFPERDPGTQTIAQNFFLLPKSALRASLGVDDATVDQLIKSVAATGNPSRDPECMQRCGITA